MKNLMDEYINFTVRRMKKYMRLIFARKYDDEIASELLKTYINSRYYNVNYSEKNARAFYLKINEELNKKCEFLKKNYDEEKHNLINNFRTVFNYILFFDNVRKVENFKTIKSVKDVIKQLVNIREKEFGFKTQEEFAKNLYEEVASDMLEKELYLDKFDTDSFSLNLLKHKTIDTIYYVELQHHLDIPKQYSEYAIDEVYNSGIIAEDKLQVEYILLSAMVIKDILDGNFKDVYIAEFTVSLFKKKQKLDTVLNLIKNEALQEKIKLSITYEELTKNKKSVLAYVNKGYQFAITLDDSLKSIDELEKLKMFDLVLVPKNIKLYKEVTQSKSKFKNVIEQ